MVTDPTATLHAALAEIARGRTNCGRPLAAEKARGIARKALVAAGMEWTDGQVRAKARAAALDGAKG